MSIRSLRRYGLGGGLLLALAAPQPAAAGSANLSCVRTGSAFVCAGNWGESGGFPRIIRAPTAEEEAEAKIRERKWIARCQPTIQQDRYGVGRYQYAAPGCEFGKSED